MKLKLVSCLLILGMLVSSFTAVAQTSTSPLSVLNELERVLYGDARKVPYSIVLKI